MDIVYPLIYLGLLFSLAMLERLGMWDPISLTRSHPCAPCSESGES